MVRKALFLLFFVGLFSLTAGAQDLLNSMNQTVTGNENGMSSFSGRRDSTKSEEKFVPTEIHQWRIDDLLGDTLPIVADTLSHQYQNWHFTEGMNGEYNFLGNMGAPRQSRIFFHRHNEGQFIFLHPYDYFITRPSQFIYTDTKSPYTNLSYQSSGDKVDGDDRFRAYFASSAGRHFGVGFVFDYLYGRGRYDNQSTAFTNFSLFSYYRSPQYGYHLYVYNNHMKMAENGGITDDNYITHPENMQEGKKNFSPSDIPTNFSENWNRNENFNLFFTQHYNIGYYKHEIYVQDGKNIPLKRGWKKEVELRDSLKAAADRAMIDSLAAVDSLTQKANGPQEEAVKRATLQKNTKGAPSNAPQRGPRQPRGAMPPAGMRPETTTLAAVGDTVKGTGEILPRNGDSIVSIFVPVTQISHTIELQNNMREFITYITPTNYYAKDYLVNDSIDKTRNLSVKNTVALSMLEGFSKWTQAGLTAYASYEYRDFTLPDSITGGGERVQKYKEHNVAVGGILKRTMGKALHFNFLGETTIAGEEFGSFKAEGNIDLNFHLWKDTVSFNAKAFVKDCEPSFYYRHYHSQHYWWDDNDLDKEFNSRIEGTLRIARWRTELSAGIENLKNYTYFANTSTAYTSGTNTLYLNDIAVKQCTDNIQVFSATLKQDFKMGILHLDLEGTYQKSSNQEVLPLPEFNGYANLYLAFKIARVLSVEAGADVRYFTRYYAPDYSAALGQFYQQNQADKIEIGNYPVVNMYLNFNLKRTRFYAMFYHVNEGMGDLNYFTVPHYPLNPRIFMLGLSWNFYD